jgi:signal transduction histidine kinase
MDREAVNGHALSFTELAQVVHDFKGPLSVVVLETQVLQKLLDDGAHDDMVNATRCMLLNLDFIDRMVHDLIDSCAIDAGRFELHRAPADLRTLLENVTTRLTTRDRGRIVLEAPNTMTLNIDALRVERVIANLLQNALKYSADATRVVLKLDAMTDVSRVSVIDTGPGLAREDVSYVFDEYRRATTLDPHEGSGLGLHVSKRIVEAHGGRIGVESSRGIGSKFFFELPLR